MRMDGLGMIERKEYLVKKVSKSNRSNRTSKQKKDTLQISEETKEMYRRVNDKT